MMRRSNLVHGLVIVALVCTLSLARSAPARAASTPHLENNALYGFVADNSVLALLSTVLGVPTGALGAVFTPRVVSHPKIFNIFWGDNWDNRNPDGFSQAAINAFTSNLTRDGYFDGAAQYGVGSASFAGSKDTSVCGSPGGDEDNSDILAWVTCTVQFAPGVPLPDTDGNSIYNIWLPQGTFPAGSDHCATFTGYHFMSAALTVQDFVIPDIQQYAYTVLPVDCATKFASDSGYPSAFDEATVNASHEMIEAATDPTFGSAWVDLSTFDFDSPDQIATKGEAADICEPGEGAMPDDPVLLNDGTVVAPYWSNHDIACYPKAHEIYFGETGLPDMVPGKVAIAAIGTPVTLPQTLNVADGASEAWAFLTPIAGLSPGIRYVTSDPGSGGNIEVNAQVPDPCTTWPYSQDYLICDIAAYSQQDYLTVQANPVALQAEDSSLTGSDWEADGGLVDLSTDAVIPSGADRYRFSSWTGAVSDPLSPSTTTVMNGPQTVTANYSLQHLLTVNTSGLPSPNLTHVTLEGSALGTANDPNPLAAWVDDGASLATLNADGDVNGADGIQYFFQGFTPALPATLTAQLTTTAGYLTMAQIINAALASGGVFGPNAAGQAASLTSKFSIVQADIAAGTYATALGDTGGFINQVQAQAGKAITPATATTLQLDAAMTYHIALCLGASQLSVTQEANDYASYKTLVGSLGGMALPPC